MPAPERRAAHDRRPFHDDEARLLQMLHEPLGDDPGHDLAAVPNLLSAAVARREGERASVRSSGVAGVRSTGSGMPSTIAPRLANKERTTAARKSPARANSSAGPRR